MKKNKSNKSDGFVYRKDEEIVEEMRQDFLKIMGDSEPTRIILKHLFTSYPSSEAVRKASLEFNKYRLNQKYAAMEEFK